MFIVFSLSGIYLYSKGMFLPAHYEANSTTAAVMVVPEQSAPTDNVPLVALSPKPEWLFATKTVSEINIDNKITNSSDGGFINSTNNLDNSSAVLAYYFNSKKNTNVVQSTTNKVSSLSKNSKIVTATTTLVSRESGITQTATKTNNKKTINSFFSAQNVTTSTVSSLVTSFQVVPSTSNYISPVLSIINENSSTSLTPVSVTPIPAEPAPTPIPTSATDNSTVTNPDAAILVSPSPVIPPTQVTPPMPSPLPAPVPTPPVASPPPAPTPAPVPTPTPAPTPTPTPTPAPLPPPPAPTPAPTPVPLAPPSAPVVNSSQNYKFGISLGQSLLILSRGEMDSRLDDMASLGVGWIRFDIDWGTIQPVDSTKFDWVSLDNLVASANARNIKMLPILDFTPKWARPAGCTGTNKCAPRDPAEFATFAAEVVKRYAPKGIHDWEIWNEPNTKFFWQPLADATAYTDLVKAAYDAIKSVDPSANVIAGSMAPAATTNGNISPYDFLNSIYQNGGKNYFDSLSFHPYSFPVMASYNASWNAWQQMANTPNSLRSLMSANGDDVKKIWITEFGAPTGGPGALADVGNYNLSQSPDHVTEDLQTSIFTDSFSLYNSYSWSGPMFWYSYKDLGTTNDTIENFFGIIRFDGTLKPIYDVMKSVLHQ